MRGKRWVLSFLGLGMMALPCLAPAAAAGAGSAAVSIQRAGPSDPALLARARMALHQGDLEEARAVYAALLARDPESRDGLLGRAAIAVAGGEMSRAAEDYRRLLDRDPGDIRAKAALRSLLPDLSAHEGELRVLRQQHPHEAAFPFLLGSICASQNRWPEARRFFAAALDLDPGNGDCAFNLAVSLERLRNGREAAAYYRVALASGLRRPALFDRAAAEARVRELAGEEHGS